MMRQLLSTHPQEDKVVTSVIALKKTMGFRANSVALAKEYRDLF